MDTTYLLLKSISYASSQAIFHGKQLKDLDINDVVDADDSCSADYEAVKKIMKKAIETNGKSLLADLKEIQDRDGYCGYLGSCIEQASYFV